MKDTDIAIVGMAGHFPGAQSIEQYWTNISNGVDSITDVPANRIDPIYFQKEKEDWEVDRFYCTRGGFCELMYVDPTRYGFLPIAAQGMEPEQLFIMKVAHQALEDANVFEKKISLQNCCAILGKGNFGSLSSMRNIDIINTSHQVVEIVRDILPGITEGELDKIKKAYQATKGRFQADTAIALMPNLLASLITNKLDMHGPAYTVDGACAASIIAINHASQLLVSGQCDIALAGGIHAGHSAMFWSSFNMLGALSHKGVISPFSEDADGLLIGEGGGVLVLKTLKKAIQDEDRIYAVIKGTAIYSDGAGVSVMAPNTKGQQKALELAWQRSGLDPKKIGLIEAHGTATIIGDKTEINTLNEFFGMDSPELNRAWLGSVKSNIGHIMPAAGMAGMIKTALALYHRQIPPTLHAERPAKALENSRFQIPQTAMDWDESKYPLVAGVNAFGFGGINSHAVLTAYQGEGKKKPYKWRKPTPYAVAVGAATKEALLKKIDEKEYNISDGDYRLVVFNPTPERLLKARSIVEKDKSWKGRMDIWFSNSPLLTKGGKIAFLFPGFNMDMTSDVDTIADYFNLERPKNLAEHGMLNQSLKLYQRNKMMDAALKKLGVKPDMYAGHSVGEWHASEAAGLVPDETSKTLLKVWLDYYYPEGFEESKQSPNEDFDSYLADVYFVAVGCGYNLLEPLIKDVPNLYLSNDNCPSQILMCGTRESTNTLIEILGREKIYYQELPYKSGYHTPFLKGQIDTLDYSLKHVKLQEPEFPMYSATSLDLYPTNMEDYKNLTIKHLSSTVRFRELIEKLYNEEEARVFIQIGTGNLTGFVDDILKNKEFSSIGTSSPLRDGIDQVRRVVALLFIEGQIIDNDFLGIKESEKREREMELPTFLPIVHDFPLIREAMKKHGGASINTVLDENTDRPLVKAMNDSMREMASVQAEMVELYKEVESLDKNFNFDISPLPPKVEKTKKEIAPSPKEIKPEVKKGVGTTFEEQFSITLDEHPYLMDHTIVKQPKDWPHTEDLNPVIPMAMSIELMAEAAQRQDPSKKILALSPFSVFQWMAVQKPFNQTLKGSWVAEDKVSLGIQSYVSAEVKLGDEFPTPPEEYTKPIDLGENIIELPTRDYIYKEFMFHGEVYKGVVDITAFTKKGMRALVKNSGGKGSMIDTFGQLIGVYIHMTQDINQVTFPVKVANLEFYQDMHDQEGIFEYTVVITELNDDFIIGDMIVKRDGKLWCIAKDWLNRRFELDKDIWNIVQAPLENKIGKELADNVMYYEQVYSRTATWAFLEKRYLNYRDKEHYAKLVPNKQKEFLISQIAVKEVIRKYLLDKYGRKTYPVEIFIGHDEKGKPYPYGIDELKGVEISISHKLKDAVAIVSEKPVGIDLESIEDRGKDFMELSFTENELKLLKGKDSAEWPTRFWVAKEAYGKMMGTGLQGNPKRYEVEKVDGEILYVNGVKIKTVIHKDKFIAGWTIE